MSSKSDEKERRNASNASKKKKHKYKSRDVEEEEEELDSQKNKYKQSALDVDVTPKFQKLQKHIKHDDSEEEIKSAKQTKKDKKKSNKFEKVLDLEKVALQSPVKQMPTLSADNNNENEGAKNRKDKNNIVDGKNSHSSKSKNKPKIYSSSDEVVGNIFQAVTKNLTFFH